MNGAYPSGNFSGWVDFILLMATLNDAG